MAISFEYTERFKDDFGRLSAEQQEAARECLEKIKQSLSLKSLRHHTLGGYRPTIHKVDVTCNKAYQITFELNGTVAKLLRVGTHKQLNRSPR